MTDMKVRVEFVPRDLWVGVYVGGVEMGLSTAPRPRAARERGGGVWQFRERSIYICIVPMFPIVITRTEYR